MVVKSKPMLASERIPASEIKNVRTFAAGCEAVFTEGRPVPIGEIQNIRTFGGGSGGALDKANKRPVPRHTRRWRG